MQEAERAFAAQQMIANGTIKDRAMSMTGASAGVMKYMASLNITSVSEMTFAQRVRASTIALKEQALAWAATPMGMATIAITGISLLISGIKAYNQKLEENRQKLIDVGQQAADTNKQLSELIEQYSKLGKDGQIDLSDQETAKGIQEQIVDLVGDQASNLDLVNGKLDDEIEKLKEISYQTAENNKGEIVSAKMSAEESLEAEFAKGSFKAGKIDTSFVLANPEDYKKINEYLEGIYGKGEGLAKDQNGNLVSLVIDSTDAEGAVQAYEKLIKVRQFLVNTYTQEELKSNDVYNSVVNNISALEDKVNAYKAALSNFHKNEATIELGNYLKTNDIDSQEDFDKYVDWVNSTDNAEGYKKVLIDVANNAFPQFSNAANDAGKNANEMTVLW